MIQILLASASPARLATLRSAGVSPLVHVSDVDEDAVLASLRLHDPHALAQHTVLALAKAKAEAVARCGADAIEQADILIACDSMLEIDGKVVGKPHTAEIAVERWQRMSGREGTLHTGHWIIDLRKNSSLTDSADVPRNTSNFDDSRSFGATASTTVQFAELSDREIHSYVASGEPLKVAGGFTVDGLGGAFVRAIQGDYHNVVGISLPLVRELLAELSIEWTDCWSPV